MKQIISTVRDFIMSSTGQGISVRLKASSAFIIFAAGLFGFTVQADELNQIADAIGVVVSGIGAVISACYFIAGRARYLLMKRQKLGRFAQ